MPFNIAICGAGPAGCMLARLLIHSDTNKHGDKVSVTIFEAEGGLDFRSQGGTLDLHTATGLKAIQEGGLWDEFQQHARYDGEALQIADKNYVCYLKLGASKNGSKTGRPEIDRPRLREMLFNSLPAGTVQWNKKLQRVEARTLYFADGTSQGGFDLIVGADGAWSHVRPYLSEAKPFYSGIGGYQFSIPNAQESHPDLYKAVNRGSLFSFSDGKSVMPQFMGDGSIHNGVWTVRPGDWQKTCDYDKHDPKAVMKEFDGLFADWHPTLKSFTENVEKGLVARDLFMLPIGHRWDHKQGVTLIGDAAHVMTPFAGEGVNTAFTDALELSQAILAARSADELDQNVQSFEERMFPRTTEVQQRTYDMMEMMYLTPGAPRQNIERYVIRALDDEFSEVAMFLIRPLVYAFYFIFKLFT